MKLFSNWRSTTSYRVRAALNLKGLAYEIAPVDLVAGDQFSAGYTKLNAGQGVPTLILDDGTVLTQSMAILDYLDMVHPEPALVSLDPLTRAREMAVADTVALDIHPINNLRVIGQLKTRFGADASECRDWMINWMTKGFDAIEAMLDPNTDFSFGERPSLADLCITAQVYNARRWGLVLEPYPSIAKIEKNCLAVPEIYAAHPDNQPDAKADT